MSSQLLPPYRPEGFRRGGTATSSDAREYRRAESRDAPPASTRSPWDELIGPILFVHQVAERLQWNEDQVVTAQKNHALLGCRTRDGVLVFPAYQFRDATSGELTRGFASVMQILVRAEVDAWAVASWFVTPLRTLEGRSPIETLRDETGSIDAVRHAAMEQARAWQQ